MTRILRVVGFSGGADSQAVALWCRRTFDPADVLLLNSDAGGNEHPLTDGFIRWYSDTVFPVVRVQALIRDLGDVGTRPGATRERRAEYDPDGPLTFDALARIKGIFPSRKAQFCTEYLKLAPQRRWMKEQYGGTGIMVVRYIGVRRDESNARGCAAEREWDHYFGCPLERPLVHWSKEQVFAYLADAGEEVNPLYRAGFGRVGCAPCVNSSKGDVRNWAARFPDMLAKVRDWERRVGRTFFAPCVPGLEVNWIEDVVAWSQTERGGRQISLPFVEAEAEAGGCVSKYGLCE